MVARSGAYKLVKVPRNQLAASHPFQNGRGMLGGAPRPICLTTKTKQTKQNQERTQTKRPWYSDGTNREIRGAVQEMSNSSMRRQHKEKNKQEREREREGGLQVIRTVYGYTQLEATVF